MLLTTQNLVKTQRSNTNEEDDEMTCNGEGDKDDVSDQLQEGLLTKHLSKDIDQQLKVFNITKVRP